MKTLGFALGLVLASAPAYANYSDVDADLVGLLSQQVALVQPLTPPSTVVASADTCALPSEHIVQVPAAFGAEGPTEMACLSE